MHNILFFKINISTCFHIGARFFNIPGNMKMSFSLLKALKTGINVFKRNSKKMKNVMKHQLYMNASKNNRKVLVVIYLNDLFGIKLIFLRSELNVATF